MSDEAAEKQHQASEKRLSELKEKGQSLRSRDFTSGVTLITGVLMVIIMAPKIGVGLLHNFQILFSSIAANLANPDLLVPLFVETVKNSFITLIPIFLVVYAAIFLSTFLFGGWNFSIKAIHFKLDRINPLTNLKSIYSTRIFVELAKSAIKVMIISFVLIIFIYQYKDNMFELMTLTPRYAIKDFILYVEKFTIASLIAAISIATLDAIYSYFDYLSRTKMSTQEIKDENKEAEGSQEVKRKIKSMQQAIMRGSAKKMVPQANVVIVNPTHYAVALRYIEGKDKAPKVVSKGKGVLALYIKNIAIANAIPIYEEPLLARAIYRTSKAGAEVNPGLYMAVAIVLTYVYQLKMYQINQGPAPQKASLQIPKNFIYYD